MRFCKSVLLLCALCVSRMAVSAEEPTAVRVDTQAKAQVVEGWGASLCWWAGQVGKWEEDAKIDEVLHAFVDPDQLNMNLFRYNIGGGDDPSHRGGHMVRGKGARAEMDGFKPSAAAPYDWNADAAQRKIMLRLRQLRKDAVFDAFANSPPYWMTISGCAGGNGDGKKDNLKPENIGPFCDYLVDVCRHYRDRYGIVFRTLEPFNEPLADFWCDQGSQEGCHFDDATQIQVIRALAPRLARSGLATAIAASDETCLAHFLQTLTAYEAAGVFPLVGQINTHTYSGSLEERQKVCELAAKTGKRFWMSETGPSTKGSGLQSNLALTQKLFDDMKVMRPAAWLDWQLTGEHNDTWCVVQTDANHNMKRIKNFYVRMQVTRFFRKGFRMVGCSCREAMAAVSPDNRWVAVCVLNEREAERSFRLQMPNAKLTRPRAYRTSATEDCAPVTMDTCADYLAPPRSLTTFLLPRN